MNTRRFSANLLLVVIPFLLLEAAFRALPVSSPPHILPVSSETPVARFQPNLDYRFSTGWNFSVSAKNHSNNFGYINQSDYNPDDSSPLLMTIGDSYVEAHQVDVGNSAAEILGSRLREKGRVYSIGLSGAPLSQYLVFAEYSRNTFRPDAMVFVIIGNDFDESLLKYQSSPRFHYFDEKDGRFVLQRVDYELSTTKKLLRKSAFVRYVILNLVGREAIRGLMAREPVQSQEYTGNVPTTVGKQRIVDSKRVVDEFFHLLPLKSGLDAHEILFVIDGMRPALYSDETIEKAERSFFAQIKRYFESQALSLEYEVIDMQPVFIHKNRLDNSRFEFEHDGHWNDLGHRLVAKEIENSTVFKSAFSISSENGSSL